MLPQTSLPPPAGARPHRARRRGGRTIARAALLGAIAVAVLAVGAPDDHAGARDGDPADRSVPPTTHLPAEPASDPGHGGGGTTLSVTVPATTLVHLDSQGSVVEVWTNTGTAPHPDAETWVQRDGVSELHPADASLEERVAAIAWTGPWPPGEWHRPPTPAS